MRKIALFGAGEMGRFAFEILKREGGVIGCFVDNDCSKHGMTLKDVPIISFQQFLSVKANYDLVISLNEINRKEIIEQLKEFPDIKYRIFDVSNGYIKDRLISYAYPEEQEDVILYHILYWENEIFYIDVGSNDPFFGSVTKLVYDLKNARGINIEPQVQLSRINEKERPRDINICIGIGDKYERRRFYLQGGLSTLVEDNVKQNESECVEIDVVPLKELCKKYVADGQEINFLKIDVEGYEKQVLCGCDFNEYRPWIVVLESTEPTTLLANYSKWEYILLDNKYHFAYEYGNNRYYVTEERKYLKDRFLDISILERLYDIRHAVFL